MRLSAWRAAAPNREAMTPKVLAVLTPVLTALGSEPDPWGWVVWGDEPATRYLLLVPTANGLILGHVRPNVPGEGARVSAKLVRWAKVTVGELAIETSQGHRLVSLPIEGAILKGVDDAATRIAHFARVVIAGSDGRPWPDLDEGGPAGRRGRGTTANATRSPKATTKPKAATRPKAMTPSRAGSAPSGRAATTRAGSARSGA